MVDWFFFLLPYCLLIHASACGMLTESCHQVEVCAVMWVCVCVNTDTHSQRYSVVTGQKGRVSMCVCVCTSGSNWVELVLMGLYGMFGVISVWGLLWRPGSSEGWLGPLPSIEAVLHVLLCCFVVALPRPLSFFLSSSPLVLTFPLSVMTESKWFCGTRKRTSVCVFLPPCLPLRVAIFNGGPLFAEHSPLSANRWAPL